MWRYLLKSHFTRLNKNLLGSEIGCSSCYLFQIWCGCSSIHTQPTVCSTALRSAAVGQANLYDLQALLPCQQSCDGTAVWMHSAGLSTGLEKPRWWWKRKKRHQQKLAERKCFHLSHTSTEPGAALCARF